MLGGRAAEEIVFNDVTTGASNDLERATKMARSMVTRWGMSSKLGPMVYGQKEELVFLGREISEQRDYSESVAQEIDSEVRRFIGEAYTRARALLVEYRDRLDAIARRLIEVLKTRELVELEGGPNLDEMSYQIGGLLQAHAIDAEHSVETADWLANELGRTKGIRRLFATGGDLQVAIRRSRDA